jgi:hypothetical protein
MAHPAYPSSFHPASQLLPDDTARAVRRPALPWPEDLLTKFSLRMSSHGMSISRIDMQCDSRYALQQLYHARDMGDPSLAQMAEALFRCFEAHQSGVPGQKH